MRSVSVIMPALNEQDNIEKAIREVISGFRDFGIEGELVLVNDGSSDATPDIMLKYCEIEPGIIKMITHERPRGIGASFRDGVKNAVKDSVVMMPGDAENKPEEIFRFIPLMDHVDIIVPYIVNKEVRGGARNFISRVFLSLINISFNLSLNYTNGTVVYRRSIFSDIECKEKGFFYQVEALVKSIRKGYLFAEVPCFLCTRSSGSSKAISTRSLIDILKAYFRLLWVVYVKRDSSHGKKGKSSNDFRPGWEYNDHTKK